MPPPHPTSSSLTEELSPSLPPSSSTIRKLYQAWPARSHPLCRGRLLLGVHWANLAFNVLLTVALVVLFCVYTAYPIHWALIVVAVVLTVVTEAFLLTAALMDPGIVPRAVADPEEERTRKAWEDERDRQITDTTRRALGMPSFTAPPPGSEEVRGALAYSVPTQRVRSLEGGGRERVVEVALKWCVTCCVYRPYGASHCRDCDVCVTGFDHHCPWISNCVGSRNHRHFVAFILALTALTTYVFVVSLYSLIAAGVTEALSDSLGQHVVAIVEVVFTFVTGWCFLSLSTYHLYLIAENTTTNQHIKQRRAERQRQGQLALERHQHYHARINGQLPPPPASATVEEVPPSLDETVVGVASGAAFTSGTQDEAEGKEEVGSAREVGEGGGVGAAGDGQLNTYGAGKWYPYPDADAKVPSEGVLHAFWLFFCAPLPPRRVDMESDVVVDREGKIIAYHQASVP